MWDQINNKGPATHTYGHPIIELCYILMTRASHCELYVTPTDAGWAVSVINTKNDNSVRGIDFDLRKAANSVISSSFIENLVTSAPTLDHLDFEDLYNLRRTLVFIQDRGGIDEALKGIGEEISKREKDDIPF